MSRTICLSGLWRPALVLVAAAALVPAAENRSPAEKRGVSPNNFNIHLWEPGKVPGAKGDGPLDNPFLTVFQPPEGKRNDGAIVVAPGGSNIMLMYGAEGMNIAERYNDWGVTAFVLTYRLSPRYPQDARVADAKRALQVVRSRAAEFKINPAKVGFIGFSAGSNLGRDLIDASGPGDTNAADPVERLSSRPDYVGLIYGPGRTRPGQDLKNYPPIFLCAAEYDKGTSLGSAQLFTEITKAGAVVEAHLYQKGRHGFGDGEGDPEFHDWMPRLELFLKLNGFIPNGDKQ
jgi:acetyl esterase/lipase